MTDASRARARVASLALTLKLEGHCPARLAKGLHEESRATLRLAQSIQ